MRLRSWGNLYNSESELSFLERNHLSMAFTGNKKYLVRGEGRSYGDVCLNSQGYIIGLKQHQFFQAFDDQIGVLTCESGVLLKDIQDTFIPRGWMLAVTPGTQLITVGGAIANDIHGKNHHVRGNFGHHILEIILLRSDSSIIVCSRTENSDLFYATIGGIGLTGIILSAKIRLIPIESANLNVEYISFKGIQNFLRLAKESEAWEYTVSWIDCLSGKNVRGIFMRANHACREQVVQMPSSKSQKIIPITPPISCINLLSLKVFNTLYYNFHKKHKMISQHLYQFQYPLDAIQNWNVLYGRHGFYQYQCVIPFEHAENAIGEMLDIIRNEQQGSFLVVLKTFGAIRSEGLLSFPIEGVTLALDFPNQGLKTLNLFKQLDKIVLQAKGRLYLAKDARMSSDLFKATYSNVEKFEKYRDPAISSDMAKRLFGY